jgi:hypothetical protein
MFTGKSERPSLLGRQFLRELMKLFRVIPESLSFNLHLAQQFRSFLCLYKHLLHYVSRFRQRPATLERPPELEAFVNLLLCRIFLAEKCKHWIRARGL